MNDGRKRKPQKHQNKSAFKIQFDSLALQKHKKVSLNLLCKRCCDQINWKLQFNKYKKITEPSKCNYCHNKVVVRSYMKACDICAEKEKVCPKCLDIDAQIPEGDQVKLSAKQQALKDKQQQKAMNDYIDSLKQRSRRKVKRQYEKGIITWNNQNKYFVDNEGNQLVGLKFKSKGLEDLQKQMGEDDDNFSDENFDDQDNDQNQQKQKTENQQSKAKNNKVSIVASKQNKQISKQGQQKQEQQQHQQQLQRQQQEHDQQNNQDQDFDEEQYEDESDENQQKQQNNKDKKDKR